VVYARSENEKAVKADFVEFR